MRRSSYDKETFIEEVAPFLSLRALDREVKAKRLRIVRCADRVAILAPDAVDYLLLLRREAEVDL